MIINSQLNFSTFNSTTSESRQYQLLISFIVTGKNNCTTCSRTINKSFHLKPS
ncbi:hypothetical protein IFY68_05761 (plasmid) [Klebsiella pneumoniae]|nr:hypothetical protein PUCLA3_00156 [Klebsiella pneumoniae]ERO82996.1 hypothetical protein L445_00237 [Klebsiella pneumoniae BIDMC 16]ERO83591.1 hypothetical protein L441_05380 [Klebsiella pneumoniae BIDMC 12C]EWD21314.1 hypothetical protein P844_05300 [Klebsiella pneumoniae UCI 41]EWD22468.1 hypothetical protein P841_05216 [Klebsiella pneumoniae UCI 38]EWD23921.1 hypothetical protein P840_05207 [Klebsiella pneumoniae UCI 37]EWD39575.1 hypothetical protein P836_05278 [Klebsiella pneumoniae U